jgi:hypothetical protein
VGACIENNVFYTRSHAVPVRLDISKSKRKWVL